MSGLNGYTRVNAVDVIYAAMPAYLYLNPSILGYLLSPLLAYQESVQYQNNYAAQDLGMHDVSEKTAKLIFPSGGPFPSATGNFNGHDERVERELPFLLRILAV